jgi:hypothetical protein
MMDIKLMRISHFETEKGTMASYKLCGEKEGGVNISVSIDGDATVVEALMRTYRITTLEDVVEMTITPNKQRKMGDE